jgi:hypothetical protein
MLIADRQPLAVRGETVVVVAPNGHTGIQRWPSGDQLGASK